MDEKSTSDRSCTCILSLRRRLPSLFEPQRCCFCGNKCASRDLHPDDRFGRPACYLLNITGALEPRQGFAPCSPVYKTGASLSMLTRHWLKMAPTAGLAPAKTSLKGWALVSLHSWANKVDIRGTSGWTRTITVPINSRVDYYYPTLV